MLKCVLIDDERPSINTLRSIIENYLNDEIKIEGDAENAREGYELISRTKPDIVFLDIEMPHQTGFDMLEMFDEITFQVIFTTGFDHYAISAIKFSALDYLLKPINIEELKESVRKATERIDRAYNSQLIKNVLNTAKSPHNLENKIALSLNNEIEMVKVREIVYCRANQDYTYVNLSNGKKVLVSKNIKYFEQLLNNYEFFRTHHSYLINKLYIKRYLKGESGVIITEFDQEIPVSRRKRSDFLEWIKD